MFNRTYQLRALKQGKEEARDASLCLPWAGIFRPREAWRSLVVVAAAAEKVESRQTFYRPKKTLRAGKKKRSNRLQGTQLDLFPDNGAQEFTGASNFYRPVKNFTPDPSRPLLDVFPEAYPEIK